MLTLGGGGGGGGYSNIFKQHRLSLFLGVQIQIAVPPAVPNLYLKKCVYHCIPIGQ